MIATILGVLVALLTIFFQNYFNIEPGFLEWIFFISIFFVLILFGLPLAFSFSPLQRVEQNFTPRLFEMFRKDRTFQLTWIWTAFFVISTLFLVVATVEIQEEYLFAAWVIGFGISLDMHRHMLQRIMSYFNPFEIISMFTEQAIVGIQNDNEETICNAVDSLAEVAVKSIERHSISLCQDTVDELRKVAANLLQSAKSISHPDPEESEETVSFVLFYLFQRIEFIQSLALARGLEPVATNIINNMGKIAVDAAKCDISYLIYPIRYMGQFAQDAQDEGLEEVGVRGSIALVEVAKRILKEADITYVSIQEPFFALIGQVEEIMKEMFRQDKSMNILLLKQPFQQLKELFSKEPIASHQDASAIRADIDRVLGEFTELEAIMSKLPSIPEMSMGGKE